ncbi:unnamed protein product [Paramecium primaurelia]|uniref:Uncharacterized protein n=1 Tax=Paramecium primaurelia TaxID=5886 RepID=A0A8S1K6F1_PARPR|nr:unnamed protein product [Paramecium primaurelia]
MFYIFYSSSRYQFSEQSQLYINLQILLDQYLQWTYCICFSNQSTQILLHYQLLMLMQNFLKMIIIFQDQHLLCFVYSFVIQWSTLSSSKKTIFWAPGIENSRLRNLLYYYPPDVHQGHVIARLGESINLEFLSAYEINTARFWMWDIDDRKQTDLVLTVAPDRMTEIVIYDGNAQVKILPIQNLLYANTCCKTRLIGFRNMPIIKIQAFYAF